MKNLLEFIIKKSTGQDSFEIEETSEDDRVTLEVKADPSIIGMIIGREGKTIKNIRKVMLILAARENKLLNIVVSENV